MENPKLPKDLGLKIGSEAEVLWTNVKTNLEAQIKQAKDQLLVNQELLLIATRKIKEEQRKAKV